VWRCSTALERTSTPGVVDENAASPGGTHKNAPDRENWRSNACRRRNAFNERGRLQCDWPVPVSRSDRRGFEAGVDDWHEIVEGARVAPVPAGQKFGHITHGVV
jgi:hypothetical protein